MGKRKKTGGRVAGTPNKATADIRALAQEYTASAIRPLAILAGLLDEGDGKAESEQAQVSALKELIERGHGKATQAIDMTIRRPDQMSNDELAEAIAGAEDAIRAFRGLSGSVPSGSGQTQH